MRLSRLLMLLFVIALFAVPLGAQDSEATVEPDPFPQEVEMVDGVTFGVPAGWIVLEADGQITFASSQATIDSIAETGPVPEGEVFAVAFGGALSLVVDPVEPGAASLARAIAVQLGAGLQIQIAEAEEFNAGAYPAALVTWTFIEGQFPLEAGVIAVELNDDTQVIFWFVSGRSDFADTTRLMRDIAATLDAGGLGPESTPEAPPSDDLTVSDLTQVFTTEAGDFSFSLPQTWSAEETDTQIVIGTSADAVTAFTDTGGALPPGGLSAVVLTGQIALGLQINDNPERVVEVLAEQLLESTDTDAVSDVFSFIPEGEPEDSPRSGAFQAWGYTLGSEPFSGGVLAFRSEEEEYVVFLFTARTLDSAPYIAALQLIAANAFAIAPEPE